MPKSALPEHINDPEEIEAAFPDDSQFGTKSWFGRLYKWINKRTKTWFCFSYRCTEWWARWRKFPIILFAIGGEGMWRYESETGDVLLEHIRDVFNSGRQTYLSRIQYYKRWHIALQWPLMISMHWYPKASDVLVPGKYRHSVKGKVWHAYWNHFDADLVYWMFISAFVGRTFK